jgi:hypothetical protein
VEIAGGRGVGVTVSRTRRTGLVASVLALLAGCDVRVEGNGVYVEETRSLPAFAGVRMEDGVAAAVTVEAGLSQSVKVIGDENLVRDHVKTSVDPDALGTGVLHVWVSLSAYEARIPPTVIVALPAFAVARAKDASSIALRRPAGSTAVGGALQVVLEDRALLDATEYPTAGAAVALAGRSSAKLHSEGPVTGTVSDESRLDNLRGTGPCLVTTTSPGASVACP